jgi:hypothetical protein
MAVLRCVADSFRVGRGGVLCGTDYSEAPMTKQRLTYTGDKACRCIHCGLSRDMHICGGEGQAWCPLGQVVKMANQQELARARETIMSAPPIPDLPQEIIARAYLRLQAADVPREPWHWEVSQILQTPQVKDSAVEPEVKHQDWCDQNCDCGAVQDARALKSGAEPA